MMSFICHFRNGTTVGGKMINGFQEPEGTVGLTKRDTRELWGDKNVLKLDFVGSHTTYAFVKTHQNVP